jgi:hypothetical protein
MYWSRVFLSWTIAALPHQHEAVPVTHFGLHCPISGQRQRQDKERAWVSAGSSSCWAFSG